MLTTLEEYAREHEGILSLDFDNTFGNNPRLAWTVEYRQYAPDRNVEATYESLEEALSEVIVALDLLTPTDTHVVIPPVHIPDEESKASGKHLLLDLDWENDIIRVSLHTSPPNSEPKSAGYYSDVNKPATTIANVTGDFMINPHPQADTPEPEDVPGAYDESNLPPHLRDAIAQLERDGGVEAASRPAPGERPSGNPAGMFKERQDGF